MRLIEPSWEIWEQAPGLDGIYKQIEKSGKICYKSEHTITEDSAKPFVDRLIKSKHHSVLEHGTVYLSIPCEKAWDSLGNGYITDTYMKDPYTMIYDDSSMYYITTNYRNMLQNDWLNDLEYLCEPTEYHEKRITVHFILDRAIAMEFIRHRTFSFSMESTRYCNYSKDKFGNELTFITPCWADSLALQEIKGAATSADDFGRFIAEYYYHLNDEEIPEPREITPEQNFIVSLQIAEQLYLELLNQGWKPQEARAVLPNALKTELVMTGFISDWKHFFRLRSSIAETGQPHLQAKELADPLMKEFVKRGYL